VFSTLHTNNATGVVPRLIDMGVDPYLIAPTLILAVAQRLVRVLCEDAKDPMPMADSTKAMADKVIEGLPEGRKKEFTEPAQVYRAGKSKTCPTGTRGRVGVFEMLPIDKDMERLILKGASEIEIYKTAREKGMLSMREDALRKAFQGVIPFDEINTV
jgi:type II secretory ATPase GspE/PulE/Tfp pilus assembly ATPase PilB-like protein